MEFEYRIVNSFLWKPKTINGITKWLCFAIWEEERHIINQFNEFGPNQIWSNWEPIKFLD